MKYIFPLLLLLGASAWAAPPDKIGDDWTQASLPAKPRARLPDLAPDPARDWKQHTITRDNTEDYSCALGFGVGGELKSGGYLGARAMGQTLNLGRPSSK